MIDNQSMAQNGKREAKNGTAGPHAGPSTAKDTKKSTEYQKSVSRFTGRVLGSNTLGGLCQRVLIQVGFYEKLYTRTDTPQMPFERPWKWDNIKWTL